MRLRLETLEDRTTPTAYTWTGASDGVTWESPGNWSTPLQVGDAPPVPGVDGYPDDAGDTAYVGFGEVTWAGGEVGSVEIAGGAVDAVGAVNIPDALFVSAGDMTFRAMSGAYYVSVTGGALGIRAAFRIDTEGTISGGTVGLHGAAVTCPVFYAYGGTVQVYGACSFSGLFVLGGATLALGPVTAAPGGDGYCTLSTGTFRCDGGTVAFRAGAGGADALHVTGQADFAAAPAWACTLVGGGPGASEYTVVQAASWLGTAFGLGALGGGYSLYSQGTGPVRLYIN